MILRRRQNRSDEGLSRAKRKERRFAAWLLASCFPLDPMATPEQELGTNSHWRTHLSLAEWGTGAQWRAATTHRGSWHVVQQQFQPRERRSHRDGARLVRRSAYRPSKGRVDGRRLSPDRTKLRGRCRGVHRPPGPR